MNKYLITVGVFILIAVAGVAAYSLMPKKPAEHGNNKECPNTQVYSSGDENNKMEIWVACEII